MKKIVLLLALFFAFTINMSAQEKEETPQVQAKNNTVKITQMLKLDDTYRDSLYQLLEMKYTTMADKTLPAERKKEFSKIMEAKLRATFTNEQMAKLEAEKDFFNQLIN